MQLYVYRLDPLMGTHIIRQGQTICGGDTHYLVETDNKGWGHTLFYGDR